MGSFGTGVDGQTADPTRSESYLLALIVGALQNGGGGGGGGGGNVTIVGATQNGHTASAGSNITPSGTQTIPAGAISVEFLLFPSAVGTVNGITLDNTSSNIILQYRLDAPDWRPLTAVAYVLTAGAGALTVQTAVP